MLLTSKGCTQNTQIFEKVRTIYFKMFLSSILDSLWLQSRSRSGSDTQYNADSNQNPGLPSHIKIIFTVLLPFYFLLSNL